MTPLPEHPVSHRLALFALCGDLVVAIDVMSIREIRPIEETAVRAAGHGVSLLQLERHRREDGDDDGVREALERHADDQGQRDADDQGERDAHGQGQREALERDAHGQGERDAEGQGERDADGEGEREALDDELAGALVPGWDLGDLLGVEAVPSAWAIVELPGSGRLVGLRLGRCVTVQSLPVCRAIPRGIFASRPRAIAAGFSTAEIPELSAHVSGVVLDLSGVLGDGELGFLAKVGEVREAAL